MRKREQSELSATEIELVQMKADGYRNCEIAIAMKMSEEAVIQYLNRARNRLALNTPHQLVAYCLRQSIID